MSLVPEGVTQLHSLVAGQFVGAHSEQKAHWEDADVESK